MRVGVEVGVSLAGSSLVMVGVGVEVASLVSVGVSVCWPPGVTVTRVLVGVKGEVGVGVSVVIDDKVGVSVGVTVVVAVSVGVDVIVSVTVAVGVGGNGDRVADGFGVLLGWMNRVGRGVRLKIAPLK